MLLVPHSLLAPRFSCGNKKTKHNWLGELRKRLLLPVHFGFPIFLVLKNTLYRVSFDMQRTV